MRAPLRKVTIGPYGSPWTVETARKEAKRILGLVAAGQDPAGAKAEKRAVQKAGRRGQGQRARGRGGMVQARSGRNLRTVAEVRRVMEREVLPAWGDSRLSVHSQARRDRPDRNGIADRGAGSRRTARWPT